MQSRNNRAACRVRAGSYVRDGSEPGRTYVSGQRRLYVRVGSEPGVCDGSEPGVHDGSETGVRVGSEPGGITGQIQNTSQASLIILSRCISVILHYFSLELFSL